jgi:hypothetical protein
VKTDIEKLREFWRSVDQGDNWLDFVGVVHRRPAGTVTMACHLNQAVQRKQLKSRQFRRRKWERTDDLVSCLECLAAAS